MNLKETAWDLYFEDQDHPKRLATDPIFRGVRIVLGRPLPAAELEALTRDLEVPCSFAS